MSNNFLNIFLGLFPWGFAKFAILILIGLYTIFAAVIVRQEQLMSKVVEIPTSPVLRIVAIAHLLASFAIFFLALVSL